MFADRSIIDKITDQLVDICLAHGFDGWLLNIENAVDVKLHNRVIVTDYSFAF